MRKQWYNRGRWQIERDRHQIDAEVPLDTGHDVPVQDVVSAVLGRLGLEQNAWLREIETCWREVAGPAIAVHARPGRYERGRLTIFVDNSAWLSELSRYGLKEIRGRLQARFGANRIRDVRLQLDPG